MLKRHIALAATVLLLPGYALAFELREERLEEARLTIAVPGTSEAPTVTAEDDGQEWYWYNEDPFLELFLTRIDFGTPLSPVLLEQYAQGLIDELHEEETIRSLTREQSQTFGGRTWEVWTSQVDADPPVIARNFLTSRGGRGYLLLTRHFEAETAEMEPQIADMLGRMRIDPDPTLAQIETAAEDFSNRGVRLQLPLGGTIQREGNPELDAEATSEAITPVMLWEHPELPLWWTFLQVIEVGERDPLRVLEEYVFTDDEMQLLEEPRRETVNGRLWLRTRTQSQDASEIGSELEQFSTVAHGRLYLFMVMYVPNTLARQQVDALVQSAEYYPAPLTDYNRYREYALGRLRVQLPEGGDMDVPGDSEFEGDGTEDVLAEWEHPASPVKVFQAIERSFAGQDFSSAELEQALADKRDAIGRRIGAEAGAQYVGHWPSTAGLDWLESPQARWYGILLRGEDDIKLGQFFAHYDGLIYVLTFGFETQREAEALPVIEELVRVARWE